MKYSTYIYKNKQTGGVKYSKHAKSYEYRLFWEPFFFLECDINFMYKHTSLVHTELYLLKAWLMYY